MVLVEIENFFLVFVIRRLETMRIYWEYWLYELRKADLRVWIFHSEF